MGSARIEGNLRQAPRLLRASIDQKRTNRCGPAFHCASSLAFRAKALTLHEKHLAVSERTSDVRLPNKERHLFSF